MGRILDKDRVAQAFRYAITEPKEGRSQIEFLTQRPLSIETLNKWEVGYCPPKIKYDNFFMRGRIVMPLRDFSGRIRAFFGRRLDNDADMVLDYFQDEFDPVQAHERFIRWMRGKWINEVYNKKDHLYGYYQNIADIKENGYAIIVEGCMDVIALWDNGVRNAVAICGTAFTERQLALLKRYTNTVVIMTDMDEAGRKASASAIAKLEDIFQVLEVSLPEKYDAEDYVRKFGGKRLGHFIEKALQHNKKRLTFKARDEDS